MKKRFLALGLAIMLLAGLLLSGCSIAISAQDARKGVVRVVAYYSCTYYDYNTYVSTGEAVKVGTSTIRSSGSAFGVGKTGEPTDIFVTNRHVIESETSGITTFDGEYAIYIGTIKYVYILKDDYAITSTSGLDRSRASLCTVLYEAAEGEADIAVLRSADTLEDRMALPLLDKSYELEVGDEVIALGYPGTSDDDESEIGTLASVDHVTVTEGKISVFRPVTPDEGSVAVDTIQHSATVNHGNSGGPLITSTGEVAGINTYSFSGSSGDVATNNSIEIKYVMNVLDDLNIDYDVRKPGYSMTVIIGAAAAAAVVVIVVIVLLVVRKKHKPTPKIDNNNPTSIPTPNPTPIPTPNPAPDSGMRIQGVSGEFANRRFAIKGQLRIGRDPERNDLVYPAKTPGVSHVHCVLTYENGRLYLEDLGSSYGTFLANGKTLPRGQRVEMHIGDKFSLGTQKETFVITGRGGL